MCTLTSDRGVFAFSIYLYRDQKQHIWHSHYTLSCQCPSSIPFLQAGLFISFWSWFGAVRNIYSYIKKITSTTECLILERSVLICSCVACPDRNRVWGICQLFCRLETVQRSVTTSVSSLPSWTGSAWRTAATPKHNDMHAMCWFVQCVNLRVENRYQEWSMKVFFTVVAQHVT